MYPGERDREARFSRFDVEPTMRRPTRYVLSVLAKRRVRVRFSRGTLTREFTPFPVFSLFASGFKYFHAVFLRLRTARGRYIRARTSYGKSDAHANAPKHDRVRPDPFAPVTGFDGIEARGSGAIALFPTIESPGFPKCRHDTAFRLDGESRSIFFSIHVFVVISTGRDATVEFSTGTTGRRPSERVGQRF